MEEKRIIIVSCGSFEKEFIRKIASAVTAEFRMPVLVEENYIDLTPFYNPARRQYDADRLLGYMERCTEKQFTRIAGIFRVDLFIPIMTYIFGQAFINGRAAIVSVHRLRNEAYGIRKDETILLYRSVKEVIHELGHTFGLKHCHNPACVMRSSTYIEEIDQKESHFCSRCRLLLSTDEA